MSVTIYEGSILDCDVDAIVNPANGFLNHGAGLARVIADAATRPYAPQIDSPGPFPGTCQPVEVLKRDARAAKNSITRWRAEQRAVPTIATGDAFATSAGVLPFQGIIHAVGPVWSGGHFHERDLLRSAHTESCAIARDKGWQRVAFPAISCGLFRFPVEIAAPIAVEAVRFWACELDVRPLDVTFALMQPDHVEAYREALAAAGL